jgi:ribonuclease BN (tRNA processing enzyme)
MLRFLIFISILASPVFRDVLAAGCPGDDPQLQILGSGGSQSRRERAGTSYLVWINGKSRALINAGDGSSLRFYESGARFAELDVIALSRLHSDHSAGLPGLIGTGIHSKRLRSLPVFGPEGSKTQPSTVAFIRTLFDERRGAWRELGSVLSPLGAKGFKLEPHDIRTRIRSGEAQLEKAKTTNPVFANDEFRLSAEATRFGNTPALAWRVRVKTGSVVFVGDNDGHKLADFSRGANVMVAHLSAPQQQRETNHNRYQTPRAIGELATSAGIKHLLLAHRILPTEKDEQQAIAEIRKVFEGRISLADDLSCYAIR